MNRPEIRIVQDQQEEIKPADISQNEAEMLLAKYGYKSNSQTYQEPQPQSFDPTRDLSYEEMCRLEDEKLRAETERQRKEDVADKRRKERSEKTKDYDNYKVPRVYHLVHPKRLRKDINNYDYKGNF